MLNLVIELNMEGYCHHNYCKYD